MLDIDYWKRIEAHIWSQSGGECGLMRGFYGPHAFVTNRAALWLGGLDDIAAECIPTIAPTKAHKSVARIMDKLELIETTAGVWVSARNLAIIINGQAIAQIATVAIAQPRGLSIPGLLIRSFDWMCVLMPMHDYGTKPFDWRAER